MKLKELLQESSDGWTLMLRAKKLAEKDGKDYSGMLWGEKHKYSLQAAEEMGMYYDGVKKMWLKTRDKKAKIKVTGIKPKTN